MLLIKQKNDIGKHIYDKNVKTINNELLSELISWSKNNFAKVMFKSPNKFFIKLDKKSLRSSVLNSILEKL